jgi:hypothetical protein
MKTVLILLSYKSDYSSGDAWSLLEHLGFDALGSEVVAPLGAGHTSRDQSKCPVDPGLWFKFQAECYNAPDTGPEVSSSQLVLRPHARHIS